MAQLTINMMTPKKDVMHGDVDQVTAPSIMGEVGILPDHLPLLATLEAGPVGLFKAGDVEYFAVSGGFVEVNDNVVTILADSAEAAAELDPERSARALKDAEQQLKTLDATLPEYAEQMARCKRAQVRLEVAATARH